MQKILTVLVIAVVLAACSGDSPPTPPEEQGPPGEPSPYFGSTLSLSGNVYTRKINFDVENIERSLINFLFNPSGLISYPESDKSMDLTIFDGGLGGSGKIKDGKLSYSVGKPPADALQPIEADDIPEISAIYSDVSITPQNANAAFLYLTTNDLNYPLLTKEKIVSESVSPMTAFKITTESTSYIYVDKNITINAQGSTYTDTITDIPISDIITDFPLADNMDIPVKLTTHDIRLTLKTGWNAIYSKFAVTVKLLTFDPLTFEADGDVGFSVGLPPSHKWVLNSYNNEFLPFP